MDWPCRRWRRNAKKLLTMIQKSNSARSSKEVTSQASDSAAAAPEEHVYRALYEGILDHRLAPGTKLKEIPIAEAFGVTRGVVRKALARLAAAKVVTLRSQYGATVADPSPQEVKQIFEARQLIEQHLVEALAANISQQQIQELQALMDEEAQAYRSEDVRTGIKLSMDFHTRLAEFSGNPILAEFLQQLVARTPQIFLANRSSGQSVSCSEHEHSHIVEAIIAGDGARAADLMSKHLSHLESHTAPAAGPRTHDLMAKLGVR